LKLKADRDHESFENKSIAAPGNLYRMPKRILKDLAGRRLFLEHYF
jgi:hypothetical protein